MAASLRSLIQRLDPNLPVNNLRTLEEQVSSSMLNDRLVTGLSVSLALLAALLAGLGLYGVLAYVVARRTREIGIRIALGGERADILRLVVGQVGRLTAVGGAIGIVAALVAMRWVARFALRCPHAPQESGFNCSSRHRVGAWHWPERDGIQLRECFAAPPT